jgi:hypothetical protein
VEKSFRKNGKGSLSTVGSSLPRNKGKTGESKTNSRYRREISFHVMWALIYNFSMIFNLVVIC